MKIKYISFLFIIAFALSDNTLIHINSTYFDGKPKEVIIYGYDDIYKDNSIKIIDKLHFDRKGKLIFNYSEYFSGQWKSNNLTYIKFSDNQVNFIDRIDGCSNCYSSSSNWNISFIGDQLIVDTKIDPQMITKDNESEEYLMNSHKFKVKIISPDRFELISYNKSIFSFNKIN